ncbi:MAG: porin [Porticoccaceae bacterium]
MASVNRKYLSSVHLCTFVFIIILLSVYSNVLYAREIIGEKLNIYGTLNGSIDYLDSDVNDQLAEADPGDKLLNGETGISSNTTKIGVRGRLAFKSNVEMLYQVEQFVDLDSDERIDFSTRNTFLGISGNYGEVLVGRHDTPFKLVSSRYSILTDTIGDRRAILGASAVDGNRLNRRADNMILWRNNKELSSGNFDWIVQYSPNANNSSGIPNNDDRSMWGLWGQWRGQGFSAAIAHDSWSGIFAGEIGATRIAARKTYGPFTSALIYEHITHDLAGGGQGILDRDAWGANLVYASESWKYSFQILSAMSHALAPDSGAQMVTFAAEKAINSALIGYAAYSQTNNEENASYQAVDGGHGDELGTLPGGTPRAFSVGLKYSF